MRTELYIIERDKSLELGEHNRHAAGNKIHVSLPACSEAAASIRVLLQKAYSLEILQDVPDEATCNAEEVRSSVDTCLLCSWP